MKDIQSIKPNADLENMSEEEFIEIMEELSESPKMKKKYERLLNPYVKKFTREYDLDKYTMILIGDKNAEYLEEIKEESISDLTENLGLIAPQPFIFPFNEISNSPPFPFSRYS